MEDSEKIRELQFIEQSLQNILLQKQAYQMDLSETDAALAEIDSSGEDTYKIIGQLFLKVKKEKLKKDLEEKKKLMEIRLSSLERQETQLSEKLQKLRDEFLEKKK